MPILNLRTFFMIHIFAIKYLFWFAHWFAINGHIMIKNFNQTFISPELVLYPNYKSTRRWSLCQIIRGFCVEKASFSVLDVKSSPILYFTWFYFGVSDCTGRLGLNHPPDCIFACVCNRGARVQTCRAVSVAEVTAALWQKSCHSATRVWTGRLGAIPHMGANCHTHWLVSGEKQLVDEEQMKRTVKKKNQTTVKFSRKCCLVFFFSKIIALPEFSTEAIELAAAELWLSDNAERYRTNSRPLCISVSVCVNDWQGVVVRWVLTTGVELRWPHRHSPVNIYLLPSADMLHLPAARTAAAPHTSDPSAFKEHFSVVAFWFADIDVLFDHWSNNDRKNEKNQSEESIKIQEKYQGRWCLNERIQTTWWRQSFSTFGKMSDENVRVGKAIMGCGEGPSVTCFVMMTSMREDNRGTVEENKEVDDG